MLTSQHPQLAELYGEAGSAGSPTALARQKVASIQARISLVEGEIVAHSGPATVHSLRGEEGNETVHHGGRARSCGWAHRPRGLGSRLLAARPLFRLDGEANLRRPWRAILYTRRPPLSLRACRRQGGRLHREPSMPSPRSERLGLAAVTATVQGFLSAAATPQQKPPQQ